MVLVYLPSKMGPLWHFYVGKDAPWSRTGCFPDQNRGTRYRTDPSRCIQLPASHTSLAPSLHKHGEFTYDRPILRNMGISQTWEFTILQSKGILVSFSLIGIYGDLFTVCLYDDVYSRHTDRYVYHLMI